MIFKKSHKITIEHSLPCRNDDQGGHGSGPFSMETTAEAPYDDDTESILYEESRTPNEKLFKAKGTEVGIYV